MTQVEKLTTKQAQIDPNEVDELERLQELQAEAERKKNKLLVCFTCICFSAAYKQLLDCNRV